MNSNIQSLMQEVDKLFDANWEEFYHDEKVRSVYQQMKQLADTYSESSLRGQKDSTNMLVRLQDLRKELDDAISEASKHTQQLSDPENQEKGIGALRALAMDAHQAARLTKLESLQSEIKSQKAATLSKLSLLASLLVAVLVSGFQGYMYFEGKAETEESIKAHFKRAKNEISAEVLEKVSAIENPQVQTMSDKTLELEAKITSLETEVEKIAELETRTSQLQAELEKNASLRGKISELEQSLKSNRSTTGVKSAKASKQPKAKAAAKKGGAKRSNKRG
ncbi:MAG TPA: hypothetical protein VNJ01_17835 [Bacteriovoracaceae bacterium]|nr:hypothetical protein [Bacteriovoracaceae bacterium]